MKVEEALDRDRAKEVIKKLKEEKKGNEKEKGFSSRDFIRRYSKEYNKEYVGKLSICNSNPRILHSLMARCLERHKDYLEIKKETGKRSGEDDPTCYGNKTKVQGWNFKKLKEYE